VTVYWFEGDKLMSRDPRLDFRKAFERAAFEARSVHLKAPGDQKLLALARLITAAQLSARRGDDWLNAMEVDARRYLRRLPAGVDSRTVHFGTSGHRDIVETRTELANALLNLVAGLDSDTPDEKLTDVANEFQLLYLYQSTFKLPDLTGSEIATKVKGALAWCIAHARDEESMVKKALSKLGCPPSITRNLFSYLEKQKVLKPGTDGSTS
jgi:hypothetical protein